MRTIKWGTVLGWFLMTLFMALFWSLFGALLLGEWDAAAKIGAAFAVLITGSVIIVIVAAWMAEWLEETNRPFPPPPTFTDEELDRLLDAPCLCRDDWDLRFTHADTCQKGVQE